MKKYFLFLACIGFLWSCDYYSTDSGGSSTGQGGSMARFACKGDFLYVLSSHTLSTYDITDSSKIQLKARTNLAATMETLFPTDSLLFMGSTSGMYIYNLKNPAIPKFVSEYTHFTSCDPVVVQGQYAFVTLRSNADSWSCSRNVNELQVIDILNINKPIEKAKYPMINPKGLAIDGKRLFVCDGMDLVVMDAEDPLMLTELKRITLDGIPYDLIAKNGLLIVSYSAGVKQYAYDGDTIQQVSVIY